VLDLPGEVVFSPDGTRIHVTSGAFGSPRVVNTIDLTTGTLLSATPAGIYTSDPVVTPDGARVYVTNNEEGTVTAIDTVAGTARTITVGAGPGELVLSPDGRRLYVSNHGSSEITVIDTADDTVVDTVPVTGYQRVSFSPDGRWAYVGHFYPDGFDPSLTFISTTDDRVTVFRNGGSPFVTFSADGRYAFVTTEQSVDVLDLGGATPAAGDVSAA
jgi:YVTN family beta-propeller protein